MILDNFPYELALINPIDEYVEVQSSKIHGVGLFAKRFIPKGTIVWHARPQDIIVITKDQFLTLESSYKTPITTNIIEVILRYSFYVVDIDSLIFCVDNFRFINHSSNANIGGPEDENEFSAVALYNIQKGEELTEDYKEYPICYWLESYKDKFKLCCW